MAPEITRAAHAAFVENWFRNRPVACDHQPAASRQQPAASTQQPALSGEASEPRPAAFGGRQRRNSPESYGGVPQYSAWPGEGAQQLNCLISTNELMQK